MTLTLSSPTVAIERAADPARFAPEDRDCETYGRLCRDCGDCDLSANRCDDDDEDDDA